jgi:hypothetical protein
MQCCKRTLRSNATPVSLCALLEVKDLCTPVHTGNTGPEGILKFLKSHTCNRACEHLQLPTMSRSLAVCQVCMCGVFPKDGV